MKTLNMLESPEYPTLLTRHDGVSDNVIGADNQQGQPLISGSPQRLRQLKSPKHKSMIVGAVLGDSYITKNHDGSGHLLATQHSGKQRDYLEHKRERMALMGFQVSRVYDVSRNGFESYRYTAKLDEDGRYWRHQFYPNGNKTVTRHLLNMLDAEGLAIWFMDDGSNTLHKQGGRGELQLHTQSFNRAEHHIIQNYLDKVWGIDTGLRTDTRGDKIYYHLSILAANKSRFVELLRPHIHVSMQYKIDIESCRSKEGLKTLEAMV